MLTPTKAAALRVINSENRAFTNGQVSDRQKELGLEFSGETVRRWFDKEGARKVVCRIKPLCRFNTTKGKTCLFSVFWSHNCRPETAITVPGLPYLVLICTWCTI